MDAFTPLTPFPQKGKSHVLKDGISKFGNKTPRTEVFFSFFSFLPMLLRRMSGSDISHGNFHLELEVQGISEAITKIFSPALTMSH